MRCTPKTRRRCTPYNSLHAHCRVCKGCATYDVTYFFNFRGRAPVWRAACAGFGSVHHRVAVTVYARSGHYGSLK